MFQHSSKALEFLVAGYLPNYPALVPVPNYTVCVNSQPNNNCQ